MAQAATQRRDRGGQDIKNGRMSIAATSTFKNIAQGSNSRHGLRHRIIETIRKYEIDTTIPSCSALEKRHLRRLLEELALLSLGIPSTPSTRFKSRVLSQAHTTHRIAKGISTTPEFLSQEAGMPSTTSRRQTGCAMALSCLFSRIQLRAAAPPSRHHTGHTF